MPDPVLERVPNTSPLLFAAAVFEAAMQTGLTDAARARTSHRPALAAVLIEVAAERDRQDFKWGQQDHPSHGTFDSTHLTPARFHLGADADALRNRCDHRARTGRISWADIALEEIAEALDADTEQARRAELVQVAAVIVAWIQCIDRHTLPADIATTLEEGA